MQRTHTRIAGATTALLAAGVAGFSLRPADRPAAAPAARTPAVEVRTRVIHRTIHVVRHEHPHSRGRHALAAASGPVAAGATAGRAQPVTTSASHHGSAPSTSAAAGST